MIGSAVAALIAEVLTPKTLAATAGKATVKSILHRVMNRRLKQARAILIDELRAGRTLPQFVASEDDAVAIIYRYGRAATEGAAQRNLRLMARMIRASTATRPLYADDFLRYAPMIESLSREEILLTAEAYRQALAGETDPWHTAARELETRGVLRANESHRLTQALVRTGMVTLHVVADSMIYGRTDLLMTIGSLAWLEALPPENAG
ncbi:MAG TPA: hypothetical protein VJ890_23360 [Vineibacter sp.]|nr:hypothetical protein [Vineibacter sp.]